MRLVRFIPLSLAICFFLWAGSACGALLAQTSPERPKNSDSSKYVGAEVCQGCHEEQYKTFAASAHLVTLKNKDVETQGCEGCHGPGAAHVDGGGDPEKIQRFAGASPEMIQQRCTSCHAANLGEAHSKARLTCITCHSVHHYQQLKSILITPEGQLCQRCHRQSGPQAKAHRR